MVSKKRSQWLSSLTMIPILQVTPNDFLKPTTAIVETADLKPSTLYKTEEKKPAPVEYTVVEGDNLTKIAEANHTTWLRLWQKNLTITHPDVINVGDKIVVPAEDEVLAERLLPQPVAPVAFQSTRTENAPVGAVPHGVIPGNTYDYGYCTWYVKNRRPDLPNNLGNADTWTVRAANQGYATGKTPRAGAVGQLGMHVVYVESVNGDSMTISEMNYQGWNVQSSRTMSASGWSFIY